MATFKLEIDCDNDAFGEGATSEEIARILESAAYALRVNGLYNCSAQWLRDINGNRVGTYKYEDRDKLRLGK